MYLSGKTALQVVDSSTSYSSAAFLPAETAGRVWQELMACWIRYMLGFPRRTRSDSGPQFSSQTWKKMCDGVGVSIQLSPVESHNSFGQNERPHSPLRRCYLKIKNDVPSLPADLCLRVAVKVMNDTVGQNGLVPTLLVFGTIPQLPLMQGTLSPYSGQDQRDLALRSATLSIRRSSQNEDYKKLFA
jgi:hypothetical protein